MNLIPSYLRDSIVSANSVESFLAHYYKPYRYTGQGDKYAKTLRDSYEAEYTEKGYCLISEHDSVTGQLVAFTGRKV